MVASDIDSSKREGLSRLVVGVMVEKGVSFKIWAYALFHCFYKLIFVSGSCT